MEYSIGDVSALLNLSRDMIRYYEKQGAIKASRNSSNNYRSYDSMEVFWLLEAMMHKSWGIPISEIAGIREHEFTFHTEQFLRERISGLKKEASYLELLSERLEEIRKNTLLSTKNIGNFWVDHYPVEYRCHLVNGRGDEYDRINLSGDMSRFIFSEHNLPFFSNGLTVESGHVEWEMAIQERYLDALGKTLPEGFVKIPASLCLCTNLDIGEIGQFDPGMLHVISDYAVRHGYETAKSSRIRGILLGRGMEENKFRRIVMLLLPLG